VYKAIKEQLQAHNTPICLGSTDEVMALGKSSTAPVLAYLSTNIVPAERQRRVVNLIDHLERRPTIVVATQVIEAGVDLDFDLVIRDIGPRDAINQVAGRCNRSGKKAQGAVYVIRMRNEKGKPYAELIYRQMHVRIAEELLRKHPSLPESQFPILLHDYLTRVRSYEGECSEVSRELIEAIKTLHFEELDKFKLIEEEPRELRIPVFIDLDANAKTAKTAFLEAIDRFKTTDRHCQFDRRAELKRRHADIQNYVVEVRERDNPPVEELVPRYGIRYADPERSAQCYDRETGYRRETVHAVIW
jgi:CRISPR-associated endonuclease/helicase Cas3